MSTALRRAVDDLDHPIEALRATHHRIELRLALLAELCEHVGEHGSDSAARTTADVVLRYFDDSESIHQADEEIDLFSALREAAMPGTKDALGPLLERLAAQHDDIQRSYRTLRPHLAEIASGRGSDLPPALCARLYQVYMHHIALEEEELLPLAEASLSGDALARLGSAMAARRSLPAFVCAQATRRLHCAASQRSPDRSL
jgi:hemerythrin-like domain-containing protein